VPNFWGHPVRPRRHLISLFGLLRARTFLLARRHSRLLSFRRPRYLCGSSLRQKHATAKKLSFPRLLISIVDWDFEMVAWKLELTSSYHMFFIWWVLRCEGQRPRSQNQGLGKAASAGGGGSADPVKFAAEVRNCIRICIWQVSK